LPEIKQKQNIITNYKYIAIGILKELTKKGFSHQLVAGIAPTKVLVLSRFVTKRKLWY